MIPELISTGKIYPAFLIAEKEGSEYYEWLSGAAKVINSYQDYSKALELLNALPELPLADKWVKRNREYLEYRCANVMVPVVTTDHYWFDGEIISAEEANNRRLNFLAGRKKFTKDKEIVPVVKKERKTSTQVLVNQFLETHGHDADLVKQFPDVAESTLAVYRSKYRKLCGIVAKRAPRKVTRTARGSNNQDTVFAWLEANGHDADLSHLNINPGSAAVYRSLFRKSKGIQVRKGRPSNV